MAEKNSRGSLSRRLSPARGVTLGGALALALSTSWTTLAGATPPVPAAPPPAAAHSVALPFAHSVAPPFATKPAARAPRSPAEIAKIEAEIGKLEARGDHHHADGLQALLDEEARGHHVTPPAKHSVAPPFATKPAARAPRTPAEIAKLEAEIAKLEARGDHYHADGLQALLDDEAGAHPVAPQPAYSVAPPATKPAARAPRTPTEIARIEAEIGKLEARGDHHHADGLQAMLDEEALAHRVTPPPATSVARPPATKPATRAPRTPAEIARIEEEISKLEARGDDYHADGLRALLDEEARAHRVAPPPLASGAALRDLGIAGPRATGATSSAAAPKQPAPRAP